MTSPIETTVSDVVAGRFDEDTVVRLTGQANCFYWKTTKQGNTWATFTLIGPRTSVQAMLLPAAYRQVGDRMGPTLHDYQVQEVTVTGRITRVPFETQPSMIVTDVERHSDKPCDSLENMRRSDARARAVIRRDLEDNPPRPRAEPETGEGRGIREVVGLLRGEGSDEQ